MTKFAEVAVNYPLRNSLLTYLVKEDESYKRGDLVEVPLGNRKAKGIFWKFIDEKDISFDIKKLKQIHGVIENSFTLNDNELQLFSWMAKYYHYALGKLIYEALPKIMKRPKKVDLILGSDLGTKFELSHEQKTTLNEIYEVLFNNTTSHLVHGITGSGKSVIYLEAMKKVFEQGKSVQLLLPEINLTPQFIEFFTKELGVPILSYHSAMSASEKFIVWKYLLENKSPCLVLGVRSSVFLPFNSLGLIIVDEEHDNSFKQDDRCPYNGRDVAIKKAQIYNCPVILGSATPSVENYYKFKNQINDSKRYYELKERVGEGRLPDISLIDERESQDYENKVWPFHSKSIEAIKKSLEKKEQILIYVNKLGFSSYLQCRQCGHQFQNEDCGCRLALRYYKAKKTLQCSQCPYICPSPQMCPSCGNLKLLPKGYGTEKVHEVLSHYFPNHKVDRFDRDDITNLKSLEKRLKDFNSGDIDILVGTQMLSKGHNFKRVNLVVVLGIDSQFNFPDFRSTERAFQQLVQISGRAGRFNENSQVLIQTLMPENSLFEKLLQRDWHGFYEEELENRKPFGFPPFERMVSLTFFSKKRDSAMEGAKAAGNIIDDFIKNHFKSVSVLGPAPSPQEKRAKYFSWRILLKGQNALEIHNLLSNFESKFNPPSTMYYGVDVDPYFLG